ncbi:DUF4097 domain-containing protein [Micromonospora sp. NBC_01699]|uniref:DUF4097 family beta strand repeat-containing protein n=1 Tax=Micromonospora sp. NBC_01699 TaxID=2975984 RepID=UPI002E2B2E95|nr:DUF4097 family beta strand repeat-containing protein [Micromonospora sp. NBC_01699]
MTMFRIVTAVTAGALTLGILAGCDDLTVGQRRLDFDQTEKVKIAKIVVAPGSGDVVVSTAAVSDVRIKRVVRYRGSEPGSTYVIEGSELRIDTDCGSRCGVSYEIVAPTGVSVSGENGSGDVELSDVGDVDVKVGSGDITLIGATGTVRAQTGSGDIDLGRIGTAATVRTGSGSVNGHGLGGTVDATTGSGDIILALDTAGSVNARASSGSIELTVPDGAYRIRSATSSGTARSRLADDPSAVNRLDLETGSGDITITPR